MIYKYALPLLAVILQQFADALPLDSLLQQRSAECEDKKLACPSPRVLQSQCDGRLLRCVGLGNMIAQPMGFCVRCAGTGVWVQERMWTDEEYMDFMLNNRIPAYP